MNELKYYVIDVYVPGKTTFSVISAAYTLDEAVAATKKKYPASEEYFVNTVVHPRDLFQGIAK